MEKRRPSVIVLDLYTPRVYGLTFLREIMRRPAAGRDLLDRRDARQRGRDARWKKAAR